MLRDRDVACAWNRSSGSGTERQAPVRYFLVRQAREPRLRWHWEGPLAGGKKTGASVRKGVMRAHTANQDRVKLGAGQDVHVGRSVGKVCGCAARAPNLANTRVPPGRFHHSVGISSFAHWALVGQGSVISRRSVGVKEPCASAECRRQGPNLHLGRGHDLVHLPKRPVCNVHSRTRQ